MEEDEVEIVDAPSNFKSVVWNNFGFPARRQENGDKVVDRTKTICKLCRCTMAYTTANTTNMSHHMQRHHKKKLLPSAAPPDKNLAKGQTTLTKTFTAPLPASSRRAKEITQSIGIFIAKDMRPFSAVEDEGFRKLIYTLEPKYHIPSRIHFSRSVVPALYEDVKVRVKKALQKAERVALTTDGWTSRATQSYITITAHIINHHEWEMESYVLQTRAMFESHTGQNIAEVLKVAVNEWEIGTANQPTAVVTDNARNMEVAVREAGLGPHIKCLAHTLNLGTQAGLGVPRVSRLLGRVRRIAAFFHRSSTATATLALKQKLLGLSQHKLIIDVSTRWNSTLDMLNRYLEQQAAVTATLVSPELRRNIRDIDTMDGNDIADAEDIVKLLGPLKTATKVLSDEKNPTVSLILPLTHMIEQSMAPAEEDSTTVAAMKRAILQKLEDRYNGDVYGYLLESTVLDPRFRALPHVAEDQHETVFERLREKALQLKQNQKHATGVEKGESAAGASATSDSLTHEANDDVRDTGEAEPDHPPAKRTALEDLLGDSFTAIQPTESNRAIDQEIDMYRKETPLPLTSCPLKWWKEKSHIYSMLAPLAKAYLAVPATSVPSERVFSTAGDIVNCQRAQLLPENVDMLIFLKKNM